MIKYPNSYVCGFQLIEKIDPKKIIEGIYKELFDWEIKFEGELEFENQFIEREYNYLEEIISDIEKSLSFKYIILKCTLKSDPINFITISYKEENHSKLFWIDIRYKNIEKVTPLFNFFLEKINFGFINDYIQSTISNLYTDEEWSISKCGFNPFPNSILPRKVWDDMNSSLKGKKAWELFENLPMHQHKGKLENDLWFGAAWQMYFSEAYYHYIPKILFDEFNDCNENIVFENGLRRITLFDNPFDSLKTENIKKLWKFRLSLGMDTIGHELEKVPIEPLLNVPVIITRKNTVIGFTRVTRYLDKQGNLCNKNDAKKMEIKEFLEDGITCVLEETKEKGLFGWK